MNRPSDDPRSTTGDARAALAPAGAPSLLIESPGTGGGVGRLGWLLFLAAAALGVYARLYGLGSRPLTIDEYYFLVSIEAIVDSGLPALPAGGYYTRGILLQYLTAGFVWLLPDPELALRLPAALFGLGTVALAYVYARRTLGTKLALAVAALLLLSSWHIEFSRFGRMYAGFQFFVLLYLVGLDGVARGAEGWRRYLPHGAAALAMLCHDLTVLVLPLLVLPLLAPGVRERFRGRAGAAVYALASAALVGAALVYRGVDFRLWGVTDRFPPDMARTGMGDGVLELPAFPFWQTGGGPELDLLAVAILALAVGLPIAVRRHRRGREWGAEAVAAALVASAALHALVLTLACAAVLLLRHRIHREWRERRLAAGGMALGLAIAVGWLAYVTWLTYGAGSRAWIAATGSTVFRDAVRAAFVWPDPSAAVIEPWARELPLLGLLILGAVLVQLVAKARRPLGEWIRNPALIIVYALVAFGFFDPSIHTTRYTFFLVPVALAALVLSAADLARLLAARVGLPGGLRSHELAIGVVLGLFALTADFDPVHIARVSSPAASFRLDRFESRQHIWYARRDFASPGRYLEAVAGRDEGPIVVVNLPPVSYYLEAPHAVYLDRGSSRFQLVSRRRGTVDLWSGRRLLSTLPELRAYTEGARRVWLALAIDDDRVFEARPPFELDEAWGVLIEDREVVFTSRDGAIEVVRVDLRPADSTDLRPADRTSPEPAEEAR